MSEEMVVRQAAPTLAGIKTGSLFPCPCTEKETLLEEIRAARSDVMLDAPQYLGVQSLDASGVVLRFWVKVAEKDIYAGTRALNRELLLGFRRLGVECPYPQMDIHTK